MRHTLYIIASLLLLAGCSAETEYPAELSIADSLADHGEPRAALSLLDSVSSSFESWSEPVQMRYALLKYKAQDKADVPITSDSTILPILHYYERTQEHWLPEAYYYAARTYTELGDAPRALDYYQHAATEMEKDGRWSFVLARVYAQMGDLFSKRRLVSESISSFRKSADLYEILKDSSSLVNIYSRIAGEYRHDNWDSVNFYTELAFQISSACHDTVWYLELIKDKAGASVLQGDFAEAEALLDLYFKSKLTNKREGIFSVAARLYDSLGREDQMEYYLLKMAKSHSIYIQKKASGKLAELYAKRDKNRRVLKFIQQYQALNDSVILLSNSQVLRETQASFNYNNYVRKAMYSAQEAEREKMSKVIILFVSLITLIILGGLVGFLTKRYKTQKRQVEMQNEKLRFLATEKIPSLETALAQKEQQYADASLKNDSLESEIHRLRQDIHIAKQKQMAQASRLAQERFRLGQTEVYNNLLNSTAKIHSSDILAIEQFYQEYNPSFLIALKSLCPLSEEDWSISLLIRMGFSQKHIAELVCKTAPAVHLTRKRILKRLNKDDAKVEEWNHIVEAL